MKRKAFEREFKTLHRFVEVYCRHDHGANGKLCEECEELLQYARRRLEKCPYDPKPKCKDCATHCYRPSQRERIRAVMRFSGMHFAKRGRIDWMIRYFL